MNQTRLVLSTLISLSLASCGASLQTECDRLWAATYQQKFQGTGQSDQPIASNPAEYELAMLELRLANRQKKVANLQQLEISNKQLNSLKAKYLDLSNRQIEEYIDQFEYARVLADESENHDSATIANAQKLREQSISKPNDLLKQDYDLVAEIEEVCGKLPLPL